eukprot:1717743-Prymnesium_polylepis.1
MACLCVVSALVRALSFAVLLGTVGLAVFETARPILDVVDLNTMTGFELLTLEHFRGLAVYGLGLVHGVVFAALLRGKKQQQDASVPPAEQSVATAPVVEEIPPPPIAPHPDDLAGPTPRTLLKNVLNEVNLNDSEPAAPAVRSPTIMSIDDYEVLKKSAKDDK